MVMSYELHLAMIFAKLLIFFFHTIIYDVSRVFFFLFSPPNLYTDNAQIN
jgi:hypothetical protein